MDTRALARNLLEEFAETRGPLMREPAWAVMRAIALAMLTQILRAARDPRLRVMAAGTLETHTGASPSKRGASKKEWAVASALFADVVRVAVAQVDELTKREALADLLANDEESDPFERYWKWLPVTTIFAALLDGPTASLQLQAARWILSRSRALAERVGYGKREEEEAVADSGMGMASHAPTTDHHGAGRGLACQTHVPAASDVCAPP